MSKLTLEIYPIYDENYWDYNIYSLAGLTDDYWDFIDHQERFVKFFQDTVTQQTLYQKTLDCQKIDTTFFLNTIGEPTCRSRNGSAQSGMVSYFYYFKLRFRNGPCPNIFDQGHPQEGPCDIDHFKHCTMLGISFSKEGIMYHMIY